jgi:hypothetical protein
VYFLHDLHRRNGPFVFVGGDRIKESKEKL